MATIDPPYRSDPFQNIVNVNWGGLWLVVSAWNYSGIGPDNDFEGDAALNILADGIALLDGQTLPHYTYPYEPPSIITGGPAKSWLLKVTHVMTPTNILSVDFTLPSAFQYTYNAVIANAQALSYSQSPIPPFGNDPSANAAENTSPTDAALATANMLSMIIFAKATLSIDQNNNMSWTVSY